MTQTSPETETLVAMAQAFVDRKYVSRADARQKEMGLAYVEAERKDLAREIVRFIQGLGFAQTPAEPFAWRWNTRADPRWRVTIERPVPNDRTAFDKIEPLYTAVSDTSRSAGEAND
jgi:hypothetical protein